MEFINAPTSVGSEWIVPKFCKCQLPGRGILDRQKKRRQKRSIQERQNAREAQPDQNARPRLHHHRPSILPRKSRRSKNRSHRRSRSSMQPTTTVDMAAAIG